MKVPRRRSPAAAPPPWPLLVVAACLLLGAGWFLAGRWDAAGARVAPEGGDEDGGWGDDWPDGFAGDDAPLPPPPPPPAMAGGLPPGMQAATEVTGISGGPLGYPVSVPERLAAAEGLDFPAREATWRDLVAHMNRNVSVLHQSVPRCGWAAAGSLVPDESLPRTRLVLWALAEIDAKWFQGLGVLYHLDARTELGAVRAGGAVAHAPWAEVRLLADEGRVRALFRRMRAAVEEDDPFRGMRTAAGRVRVRQDGAGGGLSIDFVPDGKAFVRAHPEAASRTGLPVQQAGGAMDAVREHLGPQGWTCAQGEAGPCSVRLVRVRVGLAPRGSKPGSLCRCAFAPLRTGLVCRQDAVRLAREAYGSDAA